MAKQLLFEIGSEELPSSFVRPALADLREQFEARAREARIGHGALRLFGTPRRLALLIDAVEERQQDLSTEVLGPPVKVAFDAEGKPTAVAQKWAAAQGLEPMAAPRKVTPKGEYLFTTKHEAGRATAELLPELLRGLLESVRFKKSMRWGWGDVAYARPIQWLCALYGESAVIFEYAEVTSGGTTRGHRFLANRPIALASPADYERALEEAHVIADPERRKALILEQASARAHEAGGELFEKDALLETVTFLVEEPHAVLGRFEEQYLELPSEVLVSEAQGHQRYFNVAAPAPEGATGAARLMPAFVAISNMPVKDVAVSRKGYERVLRARLSDARFFLTEDRKRSLESRVEELKRVVFQEKLGTLHQKVERIRALSSWLTRATEREMLAASVDRAALLCKADLTTGMVGEFPELQGVMGREYAEGVERPEVAKALFEHYLPRFAGDRVPEGDEGALVGIADRLDTLVGILAIGKGPTGAADPYGLRRACLAIVAICLRKGYRFSLLAAVDRAIDLLGERVANRDKTRAEVLAFFRERLRNLWSERLRKDVVEAVLSASFEDMVDARERLDAMAQIVELSDFEPLAAAFKRVVNIIEKQAKDVAEVEVNAGLLADEAERFLFAELGKARALVEEAVKARDHHRALREVAKLKAPVDRFFDTVRVLADEKQVRENRVALLAAIGKLFTGIADFSKIQAS